MDRKKPKAPPSSYLIFCNYERENVKNSLLEKSDSKETIRITDIQKELSSRWKTLSQEERKIFEDQAQLLKLKYNEELLEWQKSEMTDVPGDMLAQKQRTYFYHIFSLWPLPSYFKNFTSKT
ncbi:high mobility group protein B4, putative (HMGB4) [Plasmodium malariae]|uniref:High mobility group protein B4, putative (HMGB4) n=1 Tax=Plasmodium malariae TaxID=5858 RepID=A0A1A8W585_PLAMA|nr:high mobility group protein B4, putative (HMGB4) [Plasmodium malariae]